MSTRAEVLTACMRNPSLRGVELGFLAFSAIEQATWIALLVFAYQAGGVVEAGLVAGLQLLPAIFTAPLVSLAGDRWRRDRVVAASFAAQAVCMAATAAAIVGDAHRGFVYAGSAIVCVALACTRPAVASLLPKLARDPSDLSAANAVTGLFDSFGALVGPLFAAAALGIGGPSAVYIVSAFTMTFAALALIASVAGQSCEASSPSHERGAVLAGVLGGVGFLRRDRNVLLLVASVAAPAIAIGGLDVLVVAAVDQRFSATEQAVGALLAAFGAGGLVGAGAAISLVGSRRLLPAYVIGTALLGVPIMALTAVSSLPVALGLLFVSGVGESLAGVSGMTLIQRSTPDRVRGRVFGVFEGLYIAGLSLGALGVSALNGHVGLGGSLLAVGGLCPALCVVALRRLGRIDAAAHPSPEVVLGTLGGDPILAPLPAPTKRRLAGRASIVCLAPGAFATRQGEPGDRYYSVVDGQLEVRVDGRTVRTLRAGDSLGEIALLRSVPRTASVVATTPARLLAVDSEDFLEAVGESHALLDQAETIVRDRLESDDRRRTRANPAGRSDPRP